jgi:Phage tail assembly chaperone protein, TAC
MNYPSTAFGSPPLQLQGRMGERAALLAGLAARLLGWRPDEFWRATPAELATALQDEMVEPVAGDELRRLREQFPDG